MTLYKMAVEAAVEQQASFQVDGGSGGPLFQLCFFEGFLDRGYLMAVVQDLFHRKANTVMRDALVDPELPGNRGLDPERFIGTRMGNTGNFADRFYDTC